MGGGGSSRIFPWSPKADAIQWGGGVAEFFRRLQKPTRFSGGGGVVAQFFRGLQKPTRFSGGDEFSVNGALLHFHGFPKGGGRGLNRPLVGAYMVCTSLNPKFLFYVA